MLQQENWFDANTSAKEKGHHDLWTTKRKKIDDKFNHVTNLHKKHTQKMVNKNKIKVVETTQKNIINYNKQEKDDLPITKKRMNREKT